MHILHDRDPSQLCFSGSPGAPGWVCQTPWLGMLCRTWDAELGCSAGLRIWKGVGVPSRIRGWVGLCPTCAGNKTMAESATAASAETQFGPEVPGKACKLCLEQLKPRTDCLWISTLLPTQTYAGGEKQAASFQVLIQPPALLPLNCRMEAEILKVFSAVPSTGWLYS